MATISLLFNVLISATCDWNTTFLTQHALEKIPLCMYVRKTRVDHESRWAFFLVWVYYQFFRYSASSIYTTHQWDLKFFLLFFKHLFPWKSHYDIFRSSILKYSMFIHWTWVKCHLRYRALIENFKSQSMPFFWIFRPCNCKLFFALQINYKFLKSSNILVNPVSSIQRVFHLHHASDGLDFFFSFLFSSSSFL